MRNAIVVGRVVFSVVVFLFAAILLCGCKDARDAKIATLEKEVAAQREELDRLALSVTEHRSYTATQVAELWEQQGKFGGRFQTIYSNILAIYDDLDRIDARATAPAPRAVLPLSVTGRAAVSVVAATTKATERNNSWWRYSWQVTLKNNAAAPAFGSVQLQFLNSLGFAVDDDTESFELRANETKTLTGFALIDTQSAPSVVSVKANITR